MEHTILLAVDIQQSLLNARPYRGQEVLQSISHLMGLCRNQNIEVLHVRHNDPADPDFIKDSEPWQICADTSPALGELIIDKHYNSAFKNTNLKDILRDKKITTLILVGLQTEYCIDATCKSAFDLGFQVIIPENLTTTFDNGPLSAETILDFYQYHIWRNRFAQVIPFEMLKDKIISNQY